MVATAPPRVEAAAASHAPRDGCPASSRKARVGSQPVEDGAALVFITSADETTSLRHRVTTLPLPANVSVDYRTDNIRNGIRLVFESDKPSGIVPLRLELDSYARDLAKRCNITHGLPKAPAKPVESKPSEGSSPAPAGSTTTTKPSGTSKPSSSPDTKKPAKPSDTKPSASGSAAPAPPPASSAQKKAPSTALPDPFKPPPPNLPSPPKDPFK
jgi:hypothetical protein